MAEQNLSDSVYSTLSERILRWDYLPGHRLTEEELCAEFGISRSPVREALGMLVEKGFMEKKPRVGYRVKLVDFKEINELYDVRLALEEFVLRHICKLGMADERIAELSRYWADIHDKLPETANLVPAADESFHESLSQLTENATLVNLLKDIDRRIHFVRLSDVTSPERAVATCMEHLELLRAIRVRAIESALEILKRNIDGGRQAAERAIKDALARAYRNHD